MKIRDTEPGRLVTLGNLASDLGLQPRALREAAEAGTIPSVRVGSRGLLFDRDLVQRVLLAHAAGNPSSPDPRPSREEARHAQPS
jgi:hypothetical protein